MTKGEFVKALERIPINATITVGKCVVIDENKKLFGILELPIFGFGFDSSANELHFLLNLEHVKQTFWPSEVTLLKDIPPSEHDFHNPVVRDLDKEADDTE